MSKLMNLAKRSRKLFEKIRNYLVCEICQTTGRFNLDGVGEYIRFKCCKVLTTGSKIGRKCNHTMSAIELIERFAESEPLHGRQLIESVTNLSNTFAIFSPNKPPPSSRNNLISSHRPSSPSFAGECSNDQLMSEESPPTVTTSAEGIEINDRFDNISSPLLSENETDMAVPTMMQSGPTNSSHARSSLPIVEIQGEQAAISDIFIAQNRKIHALSMQINDMQKILSQLAEFMGAKVSKPSLPAALPHRKVSQPPVSASLMLPASSELPTMPSCLPQPSAQVKILSRIPESPPVSAPKQPAASTSYSDAVKSIPRRRPTPQFSSAQQAAEFLTHPPTRREMTTIHLVGMIRRKTPELWAAFKALGVDSSSVLDIVPVGNSTVQVTLFSDYVPSMIVIFNRIKVSVVVAPSSTNVAQLSAKKYGNLTLIQKKEKAYEMSVARLVFLRDRAKRPSLRGYYSRILAVSTRSVSPEAAVSETPDASQVVDSLVDKIVNEVCSVGCQPTPSSPVVESLQRDRSPVPTVIAKRIKLTNSEEVFASSDEDVSSPTYL